MLVGLIQSIEGVSRAKQSDPSQLRNKPPADHLQTQTGTFVFLGLQFALKVLDLSVPKVIAKGITDKCLYVHMCMHIHTYNFEHIGSSALVLGH